MGWDFRVGWQNSDPGEIIFYGAICVKREWEKGETTGLWVFKLEYWASFNQGIVMRRSAREMDSGAPTKKMFFSLVDMHPWKFDMDIYDCCIFKEWPFSKHHSLSNIYVFWGVHLFFVLTECMWKSFCVSSDSFLAVPAASFCMYTFMTVSIRMYVDKYRLYIHALLCCNITDALVLSWTASIFQILHE